MRLASLAVSAMIVASIAAAQTTTAPAARTSLKPLPAKHWDRSAAAHLLARAGFGGSGEEIDALAAMTLEQAVARLVDYDKIPFEVPPPPIPDNLDDRPDRAELRNLTQEERQKVIEQRQRAQRQASAETRLWWIERMVATPRPLEEKLTLFWHGHFTSGTREVRNPVFMKEQNDFLRRHCLDTFRELVIGISRDRAMLVYLDGNRNNKQQPNENYARELMELFTLGVGNYSENDVKAAARAFTGWGFDEGGFVFRRRLHDDGAKMFLGRTGKFGGEDVIDIILEQPACSKYVAEKLLRFFVRPDPDKALVEALAGELRRNNYQLRPTMRTLFSSQAFYHVDARACLIKSPVELLVSTARRLDIPIENLGAAERAMAQMGQEIMQPPNVKGWAGNEKWINTATLFNRYNFVSTLIHGGGGRPAAPRLSGGKESDASMATNDQEMMTKLDGETGKMEARSRMDGGRQPRYDPLPEVRERKLETAAAIIDHFAGYLLASPLAPAKREQLIAYLDNGKKFSVKAKDAGDRVRTMICLMCSTPEYQLN